MTTVITGTDNLDILQYSKDKSLTFTDYSDATEVQFIKGKSSVLATTITNGVALIPNQLLSGEVAGRLKFQVVNSEGTIIYENYLNVLKENIPSGYVLNHTDCKTYYYVGREDITENTLIVTKYTLNSRIGNLIYQIDLSELDTSSITSMNDMFSSCSYLTSLNLSNFNTQNVTNMNSMFNYCKSLTSLDLSNFNTQNVTNMGYMFSGCYALTSFALGHNWGINTSITSFNLSSCPLTHDSCLDVFNKLADKTQTATTSATLNLNATTKALMSADEIKIATDKGWTVS